MATVISSWGGGTSNSYVDITAANSIITNHVISYDDWTSASTAQREAAVIAATRVIDSQQYIGSRYYYDQRLEFPRELRSSFPWNRTDGRSILEDRDQRVMREHVEQATALQALFMLKHSGRSEHQENIEAGLQQVQKSIGPVKEFFSYGKNPSVKRARFDPDARTLLNPYVTGRTIFRA